MSDEKSGIISSIVKLIIGIVALYGAANGWMNQCSDPASEVDEEMFEMDDSVLEDDYGIVESVSDEQLK